MLIFMVWYDMQVIFTNESNIDRWKNKRQIAVDSKIGRLSNFIKKVGVPMQVVHFLYFWKNMLSIASFGILLYLLLGCDERKKTQYQWWDNLLELKFQRQVFALSISFVVSALPENSSTLTLHVDAYLHRVNIEIQIRCNIVTSNVEWPFGNLVL